MASVGAPALSSACSSIQGHVDDRVSDTQNQVHSSSGRSDYCTLHTSVLAALQLCLVNVHIFMMKLPLTHLQMLFL